MLLYDDEVGVDVPVEPHDRPVGCAATPAGVLRLRLTFAAPDVSLALVPVECQPRARPARRTVPTYQYACTECDHAFEQVQTFSDDALTECPECEGRLRKVFNAVGVVFKGSGFYRTDSRARRPPTDAPAKTESAPSRQDRDEDRVEAGGHRQRLLRLTSPAPVESRPAARSDSPSVAACVTASPLSSVRYAAPCSPAGACSPRC